MPSETDSVKRKGTNPNLHLKVGKGRGYRNPQFIRDGTYKFIDGVWHKRCRGPAHPEGEHLPWNEKFFYKYKTGIRAGTLTSQCRLCHQWHKVKSPGTDHGLVPTSEIRKFYIEAANRIGMQELANRTGLTAEHMNHVITGKTKYVRKANLKKVMLELVSIKRKNEYSINPYARWRLQRRGNSPDTSFCSGCGAAYKNSEGEISVQTPGCTPCSDRLSKKRARAA